MRYAQLVVGPAGSGKSTYCSALVKHGEATNRTINVINLDPAAEQFDYEPIADIRELISLQDVMEDEDLHFGPNGGLVYCMEYLVKNRDWLEEQMGDYDDDYILFDCPGQIELYTHMSAMRTFVDHLQQLNFRVCSVFLLDSHFVTDMSKFFSGVLVALSTTINLEIPAVNILSKVDLLNRQQKRILEKFLEPFIELMDEDTVSETRHSKKFAALSMALAKLVDDYSLVKFFPYGLER
ncbi:GPN-loop GTPase 3 [Halotydeus destructor]|nr:GPN-loop GTPase 3 [Halotydeus destructor]